MRDSQIKEILRLKPCDKVAQIHQRDDLNGLEVLQQTVVLTATEVLMRESHAVDVLLIVGVDCCGQGFGLGFCIEDEVLEVVGY
jgi:hypothetical protein